MRAPVGAVTARVISARRRPTLHVPARDPACDVAVAALDATGARGSVDAFAIAPPRALSRAATARSPVALPARVRASRRNAVPEISSATRPGAFSRTICASGPASLPRATVLSGPATSLAVSPTARANGATRMLASVSATVVLLGERDSRQCEESGDDENGDTGWGAHGNVLRCGELGGFWVVRA